jgi:hypothetical protein
LDDGGVAAGAGAEEDAFVLGQGGEQGVHDVRGEFAQVHGWRRSVRWCGDGRVRSVRGVVAVS